MKAETGLKKYFLEQGERMFSPASALEVSDIRRMSSAYFIRYRSVDGIRQIVGKEISGNTHLKDSRQLLNVYRQVISQNQLMAESLPKIIGTDQRGDERWVFLEYIEGTTLEVVLQTHVTPSGGEETVDRLIRSLAGLFSAMGDIEISKESFAIPEMDFGKIIKDFESFFRQRSIRYFFPKSMKLPEIFLSRFSSDLFSQKDSRLFVSDCQPKNIIVSPGNSLFLIDPDFGLVSRAFAVSQFLISLDRQGLARPFPSVISRIKAWQRSFLFEYFKTWDPSIIQELIFFYPYNLFRVYQRHARERKLFRPYLLWYYGHRLKSFLTKVEGISSLSRPFSVPELFT